MSEIVAKTVAVAVAEDKTFQLGRAVNGDVNVSVYDRINGNVSLVVGEQAWEKMVESLEKFKIEFQEAKC